MAKLSSLTSNLLIDPQLEEHTIKKSMSYEDLEKWRDETTRD